MMIQTRGLWAGFIGIIFGVILVFSVCYPLGFINFQSSKEVRDTILNECREEIDKNNELKDEFLAALDEENSIEFTKSRELKSGDLFTIIDKRIFDEYGEHLSDISAEYNKFYKNIVVVRPGAVIDKETKEKKDEFLGANNGPIYIAKHENKVWKVVYEDESVSSVKLLSLEKSDLPMLITYHHIWAGGGTCSLLTWNEKIEKYNVAIKGNYRNPDN